MADFSGVYSVEKIFKLLVCSCLEAYHLSQFVLFAETEFHSVVQASPEHSSHCLWREDSADLRHHTLL